MFLPPPLLDVALPAEQSAPRLARRALRKMLEPVAPPAFTDDALLLTSEIVSNATVIGGPCRLSAWYVAEEGALRVEIHDESAIVPVMPAARAPDQITGRGLRIVDSIATRWGIDRDEIGKSVWFEMYIKGALRTTAITG